MELLEEMVNGIVGICFLFFISVDGWSMIMVEFEIGIDLEVVVNDVCDKVF